MLSSIFKSDDFEEAQEERGCQVYYALTCEPVFEVFTNLTRLRGVYSQRTVITNASCLPALL